jgi:MFS family permease
LSGAYWLRLAPAGAEPWVGLLLLSRGLRAFADGYVAILLPVYLLALGLGAAQVGLMASLTLLGSALCTLALGAWGHRWGAARSLKAAALLMAATGLAFAAGGSFWPLALVAVVGTLNPSSGDVSVFLPLEHAQLAQAAEGEARTRLFARYSLMGALLAALGSVVAALPEWLPGVDRLLVLRGMFVLYGLVGLLVWLLYRQLPRTAAMAAGQHAAPLTTSRQVVWRLAALFSLDSFAGGMAVSSLMALWLFKRFDVSLATASHYFMWAGLLGALSQLAAPVLARRIGLLNTMVFTHIPANVCLMLAAMSPRLEVALALLLVRSTLSQMDVPARSAFVMAVVTPPERAAAASFTAVPRSLASALSPAIGGALLASGWLAAPLLICGGLKIAYDLAIWQAFRRHEGAAKL